jgi:hypothetical protein
MSASTSTRFVRGISGPCGFFTMTPLATETNSGVASRRFGLQGILAFDGPLVFALLALVGHKDLFALRCLDAPGDSDVTALRADGLRQLGHRIKLIITIGVWRERESTMFACRSRQPLDVCLLFALQLHCSAVAMLMFCQCGSDRVDIVNWNFNRARLH